MHSLINHVFVYWFFDVYFSVVYLFMYLSLFDFVFKLTSFFNNLSFVVFFICLFVTCSNIFLIDFSVINYWCLFFAYSGLYFHLLTIYLFLFIYGISFLIIYFFFTFFYFLHVSIYVCSFVCLSIYLSTFLLHLCKLKNGSGCIMELSTTMAWTHRHRRYPLVKRKPCGNPWFL